MKTNLLWVKNCPE